MSKDNFKIWFNNKMGWAKLSLLYIEMLQLSDNSGQYSRLVGGHIFSFISLLIIDTLFGYFVFSSFKVSIFKHKLNVY